MVSENGSDGSGGGVPGPEESRKALFDRARIPDNPPCRCCKLVVLNARHDPQQKPRREHKTGVVDVAACTGNHAEPSVQVLVVARAHDSPHRVA